MSESESMSAEFGTVAGWSVAAAEALGPSYRVPAGCRGSGGPTAMTWLLDRLPDVTRRPLLDIGAGIGGPAAFAREQRNASVVLVEPEPEACDAARALYGFDAVQASATDLPFGVAAYSAVWCLGVLCTVPDHGRMMRELARVVEPAGRVGMLVYARTRTLEKQPEGNHFPQQADLHDLYLHAGFDVVDEVPLGELPSPPRSWTEREDAVARWLEDHHHDDPDWQHSVAQEEIIADLLRSGAVVGRLSILVRHG